MITDKKKLLYEIHVLINKRIDELSEELLINNDFENNNMIHESDVLNVDMVYNKVIYNE